MSFFHIRRYDKNLNIYYFKITFIKNYYFSINIVELYGFRIKLMD